MLASVHLADVGAARAFAAQRHAPEPSKVDGLRGAHLGFGAPLGPWVLPRPDFRRLALIAFWDDDGALDRFLTSHPLAPMLAGGWSVRLAPLRAYGSWPGLDPDTPTSRKVEHAGPTAAITLGRLRVSQAPRFFRASAKAEGAVLGAPGKIFATGVGRPPLVSTVSLWESPEAIARYAYEAAGAAHPSAIRDGRAKPFHTREAFIRFRPYASTGSLAGANPLAADWMDTAVRSTS